MVVKTTRLLPTRRDCEEMKVTVTVAAKYSNSMDAKSEMKRKLAAMGQGATVGELIKVGILGQEFSPHSDMHLHVCFTCDPAQVSDEAVREMVLSAIQVEGRRGQAFS